MWFEKALKLQNHPKTLQAVVETQLQLGEPNIVLIDSLEYLISFSPTDYQNINRQALLLLNQGELANAFNKFAHSLACSQDENTNGIMGLSSILHLLHDHKGALAKYHLVLRENEESNPVVWNNLGASYLGLSKLIFTICSLKRALYLDPINPIIHYNLGLAFFRGNQYELYYLLFIVTYN